MFCIFCLLILLPYSLLLISQILLILSHNLRVSLSNSCLIFPFAYLCLYCNKCDLFQLVIFSVSYLSWVAASILVPLLHPSILVCFLWNWIHLHSFDCLHCFFSLLMIFLILLISFEHPAFMIKIVLPLALSLLSKLLIFTSKSLVLFFTSLIFS